MFKVIIPLTNPPIAYKGLGRVVHFFERPFGFVLEGRFRFFSPFGGGLTWSRSESAWSKFRPIRSGLALGRFVIDECPAIRG